MKIYYLLLICISFFISNQGFTQTLSTRDKEALRYEAGAFVKEFELLLNNISSDESSRLERNIIIENSFRSTGNQIFFNDEVIIEDDVNPNNYNHEKVTDLAVEKYLRNFDLFYKKQQYKTIKFSDFYVSEVKEGSYIYVEVYYTSILKGNHSNYNLSYKETSRVATIIASKKGRKWDLKIASIVFYDPNKHSVLFDLENDPLDLNAIELNTETLENNISENDIINQNLKNNSQTEIQETTNKNIGIEAGLLLAYESAINKPGIGIHFILSPKGQNLSMYTELRYLFSEKYIVSSQDLSLNRFDLSLGGLYSFSNNPIQPFAIGGINLVRSALNTSKIDLDESPNSSALGFELGGGIFYKKSLRSPFHYHTRLSYITGKASRMLIQVGVNYQFNLK